MSNTLINEPEAGTLPVCDEDSFEEENTIQKTGFGPRIFTAEQREAGVASRQAKIAQWATLDTRQDFVDEKFMRSIIRAAGLRAPHSLEPATASRLRTMLRKAKMQNADIVEAVGTPLASFLDMNAKLPLWAALAVILESTGKYDAKALLLAAIEESLKVPDI